MAIWQPRINRILAAQMEGKIYSPAFGKERRISPGLIRAYEKELQQIFDLFEGDESLEDIVSLISSETGIAENRLFHFHENGSFVPTSIENSPRDHLAELAIELLDQGELSMQIICNRLKVLPPSLGIIIRDYLIALPEDVEPYYVYPEADKLIAQGATLRDIGAAMNKSHQWAHNYIVGSGRYAAWMSVADEEGRLRKEGEIKLVNLLRHRVYEKDYAHAKVLQYLDSMKIRSTQSVPLESVLTIFQRYDAAVRDGKTLSLNQLGEGTGLFEIGVSRILKRVDLEPMYGSASLTLYPQSTKDALEHCAQFGWTPADAANFVGVHIYTARQQYKVRNRSKSRRPVRFDQQLFLMRYASDIYRQFDGGVRPPDILTSLPINLSIMEHAVQHRSTFAPEIMEVLQIMHPDRTITAPYLRD